MTLAQDVETSLYEQDYLLWLEQVVEQLRRKDFNGLDIPNLIEEIDDLGKSEKHAVASYLMHLCEHLLELKYWDAERDRCFRGWTVEITNFRLQLQRRLKVSPSLRGYLEEIFNEEYSNGRMLFLNKSGLEPQKVPAQPWFALKNALDHQWLP
ncbi:MAG: DUF29 domain-containing protein [Tildeniella torsiva UHER 1998/13D]|jgi:hypothetical protein|nr:DUF29 domain-containing protein [Tildeniella torsiva UHER 1998/13D]